MRKPFWREHDCERSAATIDLERIAWFQNQVAHLRKTETNLVNYRAAASGFLAEIDRMQLEVREYLSFLPTEKEREA
jgi:hypothetical protein